MRLLSCLIVFSISFSFSGMVQADYARLFIDSEPGDFVGDGQTRVLEYDEDLGSLLNASFGRDGNGIPNRLSLLMADAVGTTDNTFALVDFTTRNLGIPLQTGFFDNAERYPFEGPTNPGMDVSYQNRGSNILFGEFTINQVEFIDVNGQQVVGLLDLSFEQRSENVNNPALRGTLLFRHSEFVGVPEPGSCLVLLSGSAMLWIRRRR